MENNKGVRLYVDSLGLCSTVVDAAGVDLILVGDFGNGAGYETTLPVTLEEMLQQRRRGETSITCY